MRLLVIEDNEERIELFRRWMPADILAVYAKSAGRAVRIIELDPGNVYAGILLDHDLCEQITLKEELGVNGLDVVRKIVRRISQDVPILVHSMNFGGGTSMRNMLESQGFAVTRVPFQFMNEEKLLGWIADVRAEWEFSQA